MFLDSKVKGVAAGTAPATAAVLAPLFGVCPERTRLRRCVLHVGGLLGWSEQVVLDFSEAVTGRCWEDCRPEDLLVVIAEYRAILLALGAKLARRQARALAAGQPVGRRESDGQQE
jgi:hypothetical protein